jgi:hypothetical protein
MPLGLCSFKKLYSLNCFISFMNSRNRTPSEYIGYYGLLYLYFSGLSMRRTAERISYFVKRNHVSIWNWIQKYSIIPEKYRLGEGRFQDTLL